MSVTSDANLEYSVEKIYYRIGYRDGSYNSYEAGPIIMTLPPGAVDTSTYDSAIYSFASAIESAGFTITAVNKYLSSEGQFYEPYTYP
jgi:hypothetical protein